MAEISNKLGLKQHLYHECKVAEHLEIFDISRNFICGVLVCFLQNKWSGHSVEWTPNCSNSSHLQAGLEAHPGIWAKQATISVYHRWRWVICSLCSAKNLWSIVSIDADGLHYRWGEEWVTKFILPILLLPPTSPCHSVLHPFVQTIMLTPWGFANWHCYCC